MKNEMVPIQFPPNLWKCSTTGKPVMTEVLGAACFPTVRSEVRRTLSKTATLTITRRVYGRNSIECHQESSNRLA